MLRFSIPLVPSGIGVLVTLYIDRVAIRTLMTIADVGLFGIGYRIASITGLLMVGFQVALTPLIYANYRDPRMPDELATIFRAFVGFAVLIVLGLALFAREILVIVATPTFYPAAAVVPLLAPALLLSSMYVFAPGLAIAKRTGPIAAIHITSALLNTALNLTLIPLLGITGAALATLLSAVFAFGAYMVLSQRHYPVAHDWTRLALAATVGAGCLGVGLTLETAAPWSLPARAGLLVIAAAALLWLGIVRLADLRALFSSSLSDARRSTELPGGP
jgi:O-antigen/teichoic acid export membrane protein